MKNSSVCVCVSLCIYMEGWSLLYGDGGIGADTGISKKVGG